MPTFTQLLKGERTHKRKPKIDWILRSCPQKRAVIVKLWTAKPKKPNSAIWKIAKVRVVSTGILVIIYIPGQGHSLQEHSQVLIWGGRVPDLPGVHYKAIKGKLDFSATEKFVWSSRRSKFGIKLQKEK
jgi:small subunit ribosomal protein S12